MNADWAFVGLLSLAPLVLQATPMGASVRDRAEVKIFGLAPGS